MTSQRTLVFQPRPGLGDLIWHLPIIRAIASRTETGRITLFTKPSSQADSLLRNDPCIEQILWFDRNPRGGRAGRHDGPLGYPRLIASLRAARADTAILLHHGASLAAALRLAGIPHRHAYGYTRAQRRWLQPPFNPPEIQHAEAFEQAAAYAETLGFAPLPPPRVNIDPQALQTVERRLAHHPRPWFVLGIGANHPSRQWGPDNFIALARTRLATTPDSVLLLAASHETDLAARIATALGSPTRTLIAAGWPLAEVTALLSTAEHFLGNDSGPMNLRAATGRPAFALFGASGPLRHSPLIRPVIPPGGPRAGMEKISISQALRAMA